MAFTPEQMERFITDLEETKLEVTNLRAGVNADKRLLVIGLGGTGTDALLRIKNMMLKRFNTQEGKDGKAILPSNISLLAVDTDAGVNVKSVGGTRFDSHTEVALLSDPAIGAKIKARHAWPDHIKTWLNPAIQPPSSIGTGAAGVRQLGRLLLFNDISSVVSRMENKLRSLLANAPRRIPVHVVVVSGISGGTGSGTFIDTGYLVRAVMDKILPSIDRVNITAYLFLPDVNISNPDLPASCQDYIKSNGVAALKELDYLMNINNRTAMNDNKKEGRFRQIYDNTGAKFGIDTDKPPFDSVYLLSSCQRGGTMFTNGYEYALNVASESVVNFMAQDLVEDTGGMDLASFDVNGVSMADGASGVMPLDNKPVTGNYIYKVVGAASAELPIEDIANYVTYRFFQKIYHLMDFKPSQNDINNFAISVKMSPNELFKNIKLQLNSRVKMPGGNVDHKTLSNPVARGNFENALNNYRNAALSTVNDVMKLIDAQLQKDILENINLIFKDKTKGPFYANVIIIGHSQNNQRIKGLKELVTESVNQVASMGSAANTRAEEKRNIAYSEYDRGNSALLFKEGHYETYKNNLMSHCTDFVDAIIYDKIRSYYVNELTKYLSDINTGIFDVYVTILNKLSSIFNKTGELIVEGRTEVVQSGRVFSWNIIETPKILPMLDKMISNYEMDNILDKFLSRMVERSHFWITLNSNSIMDEIERFIQIEFTDIVGASMDKILSSNNLDTYIMNVANELHNQSEPTFPIDTVVMQQKKEIDYNSISIPHNCEPVRNIIGKYVGDADVQYKINLSRLTNRLFWFRASLGIPMYAYQFLKSYEPEYETALNGNMVGRHLYEVGFDWKYLPSLIPEAIWGHYTNSRVKRLNDERRSIFREAKKFGIIAVDPAHNYYCCLITDDNELTAGIDAILRKYNANMNSIKEIEIENISPCLFELNQLKGSKIKSIDKYYIYDSQGDTPELAEYKAEEHFLLMPEMISIAEKELNKFRQIDKVISSLQGLLSNVDNFREALNHYIDLIVSETIKRSGVVYSYAVGDQTTEVIKANAVKYFDYELFDALKNSHKQILDVLYDQGNQEISRFESSDEGLKTMLERLKKMKSRVVTDLQKIKFDGMAKSEALEFYEMVVIFLNERISRIESFVG